MKRSVWGWGQFEWEAIKFANRASPHSAGQQNTISHISHQVEEIKKFKSFLIKREVGVRSSSIPFGGAASGRRAPPDWQKCFPVFCVQLSRSLFNCANTAGRAKAWLCPQADLCSDSNPPSLSFAFSTQALPWQKGNSGTAETYLIFKIWLRLIRHQRPTWFTKYNLRLIFYNDIPPSGLTLRVSWQQVEMCPDELLEVRTEAKWPPPKETSWSWLLGRSAGQARLRCPVRGRLPPTPCQRAPLSWSPRRLSGARTSAPLSSSPSRRTGKWKLSRCQLCARWQNLPSSWISTRLPLRQLASSRPSASPLAALVFSLQTKTRYFCQNQNQVLLPKPGTFAKTKIRYFCHLSCLHLHQLQVQKFSVNKENTKALYESFGEFFQVPVPFFFWLKTPLSGGHRDAGASEAGLFQRILWRGGKTPGPGGTLWWIQRLLHNSSQDWGSKDDGRSGWNMEGQC